jgi:hypothetical protein
MIKLIKDKLFPSPLEGDLRVRLSLVEDTLKMINWERTQLEDCEFAALVPEGLDHVMLRVCLTVCQLCEDFSATIFYPTRRTNETFLN